MGLIPYATVPATDPYYVLIAFVAFPLVVFGIIDIITTCFTKNKHGYFQGLYDNIIWMLFNLAPLIAILMILWGLVISGIQALYLSEHATLATDLDYYLKVDIPQYEVVDLIDQAEQVHSMNYYFAQVSFPKPPSSPFRRRLKSSSNQNLGLIYHTNDWQNMLSEQNMVSACETELNILKNVPCIDTSSSHSLLHSVFRPGTCHFRTSYADALWSFGQPDNSQYVADNVDANNPESAIISSLFELGTCGEFTVQGLQDELNDQSEGGVEVTYVCPSFITKAFQDGIYNGAYISVLALIMSAIFIAISVRGVVVTIVTLISIFISVINAAAILCDFRYGSFSAFNVLSIFILIGVGGNAVVMFGSAWRERVKLGMAPTSEDMIQAYKSVRSPILFTVVAATVSLFSKLISPVIVISQLGAFMGVSVLVFYVCFHFIIIPTWVFTGWFHFPRFLYEAMFTCWNRICCSMLRVGSSSSNAYGTVPADSMKAARPPKSDDNEDEDHRENITDDGTNSPPDPERPRNNNNERYSDENNENDDNYVDANESCRSNTTLLARVWGVNQQQTTTNRSINPVPPPAEETGLELHEIHPTELHSVPSSSRRRLWFTLPRKLPVKLVGFFLLCCTLVGFYVVYVFSVSKYKLDLGIPQLFPEDSDMGEIIYIVKNYKASLLTSLKVSSSAPEEAVSDSTSRPTDKPVHLPTSRPGMTPAPSTRRPTLSPATTRSPTVSPVTASPSTKSPTIPPFTFPPGGIWISPNPTTAMPSISLSPSAQPIIDPTATPTISLSPSVLPTRIPTASPSYSMSPTFRPTFTPTMNPTYSMAPTYSPSRIPTLLPTPSVAPSHSSAPSTEVAVDPQQTSSTYADYIVTSCWGLSFDKKYRDSEVQVNYNAKQFQDYLNHGLTEDMFSFCHYVNDEREYLNVHPDWNMTRDCLYYQFQDTYDNMPFYVPRTNTNVFLYMVYQTKDGDNTIIRKLVGAVNKNASQPMSVENVEIPWVCMNFTSRTYVKSLLDHANLATDIQNRWVQAFDSHGSISASQYSVETCVGSPAFSFPILATEVLTSIELAIIISIAGFFGLLLFFTYFDIGIIILGTFAMIAVFAIAICLHINFFNNVFDLLDVVVLIAIIGIVVDSPIHVILHYIQEKEKYHLLRQEAENNNNNDDDNNNVSIGGDDNAEEEEEEEGEEEEEEGNEEEMNEEEGKGDELVEIDLEEGGSRTFNDNNNTENNREGRISSSMTSKNTNHTETEEYGTIAVSKPLHETNVYMRWSLIQILILTGIAGIPLLMATFQLLRKTGEYVVIIACVSYVYSAYVLPFLLAFSCKTRFWERIRKSNNKKKQEDEETHRALFNSSDSDSAERNSDHNNNNNNNNNEGVPINYSGDNNDHNHEERSFHQVNSGRDMLPKKGGKKTIRFAMDYVPIHREGSEIMTLPPPNSSHTADYPSAPPLTVSTAAPVTAVEMVSLEDHHSTVPFAVVISSHPGHDGEEGHIDEYGYSNGSPYPPAGYSGEDGHLLTQTTDTAGMFSPRGEEPGDVVGRTSDITREGMNTSNSGGGGSSKKNKKNKYKKAEGDEFVI
jgi:hypothetical protein